MDIFEELNLTRYLNAHDTFTKYGASCMRPSTLRAMREISGSCVDLEQVQNHAGDAIARLTHNEGAYLSNGAAGGLMICAAACLARDSEQAYDALPQTGVRREIVVQRAQHNLYDKSFSAAGAKLVFIGGEHTAPTEDELKAAITERTAAVGYFVYHGARHSLDLQRTIQIAHGCGVPVIVDAAAQNPPAENLWRFTAMGADMVVFSGGKALRGPQDSGLILGKREWILRCRRWGPPRDGVCRCCKTSREAMVGLYAAVKTYLQTDEAEEQRKMNRACSRFDSVLRQSGFTNVWRQQTGPVGQSYPRTYGRMPFGRAEDLAAAMKSMGIYIGTDPECNAVILNPLMLTPGQVQQVCRTLRECMEQYRQEEQKHGSN